MIIINKLSIKYSILISINLVIALIIAASFIGCQKSNEDLIEKYIKNHKIAFKKTSSKGDKITTVRYTATLDFKDPSYADKINIVIKLSGESRKIAGMDKLDPNLIIKNGNSYETFGEFGRNVMSDNDLALLEKNTTKDAEIEIIEKK